MANFVLNRRPRRITITLPEHVCDWIYKRSDLEGRSASNLAAYLLEQAMQKVLQAHQQR